MCEREKEKSGSRRGSKGGKVRVKQEVKGKEGEKELFTAFYEVEGIREGGRDGADRERNEKRGLEGDR